MQVYHLHVFNERRDEMAFSLNKVIIIGNLGNDPEFRTTPQGLQVCQFRVATNERLPDKSGSGWRDETEWHRVVVFGSTAEYASKTLKKGSKVCVEGRNKTRSYEKNGETHFVTEIIARNIVFLDSKGERSGATSPDSFESEVDTTSFYLNDIQDNTTSQVSKDYPSDDDDLPF